MIPGRLQYFLKYFWIGQKCDQIWTLGARIYYQNTSKNTKKYGDVLETIIFANMGINMFDVLKMFESMYALFFVFVCVFCFRFVCSSVECLIVIIICEDEDRKMIKRMHK